MIDVCCVDLPKLNYDYEYIKKYSDIKITTKILILPFYKLKEVDELKEGIEYIVVDDAYNVENELYTFSKNINIYIQDDTKLFQKINLILDNILTRVNMNNLIINEELNEIILNGKRIRLTLKEIKVLKYLSTKRDKLCLREDILVEVLGYHISSDTRIVDVYIRYLRKKLEEEGKKIKTIRGKGYIYES